MALSDFKSELFRKTIHLSSLWMVVLIGMVEKQTAVIFFTALLTGFAVFEYVRMHDNFVNRLLKRYFSPVMRTHEQTETFDLKALTGSFYFILSVLISVILFEKHIAMAGILVMILADTAAALTGKSIGKHKVPGVQKTFEGAAAYFITATIIIACMTSLAPLLIIIIAAVSTITETYSNRLHVNDNLTITLVTSGLITLAQAFPV